MGWNSYFGDDQVGGKLPAAPPMILQVIHPTATVANIRGSLSQKTKPLRVLAHLCSHPCHLGKSSSKPQTLQIKQLQNHHLEFLSKNAITEEAKHFPWELKPVLPSNLNSRKADVFSVWRSNRACTPEKGIPPKKLQD